ncbi:MAG: stealth family protein [Flavobacteriaceae bacterium]
MKGDIPSIDLVYLWVDGNDPEWLAKRNAFFGRKVENSSTNFNGRYLNNDELKYSLRSVERYASWIRKIFIVTDNQTPKWLDISNPKIQIIDQNDILPSKSLPCFNSNVLEHFLYKIPNLSEHFLLSNDDMFLNKTILPTNFFTKDGFPIIRLNRKPFRRFRWFLREQILKKPHKLYSKALFNAAELVKHKFGIYYNGLPHHNIDSYLKSDCLRVAEQIFKDEIDLTKMNHIRSANDVQRIIYSYVALAEKRGYLQYVSSKESLHLHIQKDRHYEKLQKFNPTFFCLNDTEYADDNDRKKLKVWLNSRFPEKSEFEK